MNLAPGSLYDPAAPWADEVHDPRCFWNADSRSDRLVPTHRCAEGHYFNADDVPALEATTNRLTKCPLFLYDEPGYDDGPCDAEIRELECACERFAVDPNAP